MVPSILQPDEPSKGYRKNWARLIQKIYEIDPLACSRCKGEMRIIACIGLMPFKVARFSVRIATQR